MLDKMIVQEIQGLKQGGYSLSEMREFLEGRPGKMPPPPTIRKHYNMDGSPEDMHARTAKPRAFDAEPFHSDILEIIALNPRCYMSSVHDVLVERYVDTGEYDIPLGNEQTPRNYIKWLRETSQVAEPERSRRCVCQLKTVPVRYS